MNKYTLNQYQTFKKHLPSSLKKEDFAGMTEIPINSKILKRPFTSPQMLCGASFPQKSGIQFGKMESIDNKILKQFTINLNHPLPHLFTLNAPKKIYILYIPDNIKLDKPIHLKIKPVKDNIAVSLLIYAGAHSEVTLIEDINQNVQSPLILYHQVIHAAKNSKIRVITAQNASPKTTFFEMRHSLVEKKGEVNWLNFQLGGQAIYSEINQKSADLQAIMNTNIIARAKNKQYQDFNLKNWYTKANSCGTINAKGVALDKSKIIIRGDLIIQKNGKGAKAYLKQDILNLGKQTNIKTNPHLEIKNNDVKAGHSASISNLNPDDLFYFASRGIDKNKARKILMQGFIKEQLEKINDLPELKTYIYNLF